MVQLKVVWSHRARINLYQILEYFDKRNKSKAYSIKLYTIFRKELRLVAKHPELGSKTNIRFVRCLIVRDYKMYYEVLDNKLVLHTIWDSRRNPKNLNIK